MKRPAVFFSGLAGLSLLCGYLLSKATLVGRTGISLFYKEYRFLKVGWQGALVVFTALSILYFLHYAVDRQWGRRARRALGAAIPLALVGLWATYSDFRNDLSHRLLGERFHLGAYLFWLGWVAIAVFFLFPQKQAAPAA